MGLGFFRKRPLIEKINDEVRSFYAAGVKSCNKVYLKEAGDAEFISDADWDKNWQSWSTTMSASARTRNFNRAASGKLRPGWPAGATTQLDFGRSIYNGGMRAKFIAGNCGEMAAVAAAVAVDVFKVAPSQVWICTITKPGDHVFCLIGPAFQPPWKNVGEMSNGQHASEVIDPWLNVACPSSQYCFEAIGKVEKWARENKRIWWAGASGKATGWYLPDQSYATAFRWSDFRFEPAG
jgi:hypothetical protein